MVTRFLPTHSPGCRRNVDDDDVDIKLSKGSLLVDARVAMPSNEGQPTLPNPRAVHRVIRDITGRDGDFQEPRMMRADADEGFWNPTDERIAGESREAPPRGSPSTPEFGTPRVPLKGFLRVKQKCF